MNGECVSICGSEKIVSIPFVVSVVNNANYSMLVEL
jgi:hypothetical protein